MSVSPDLTAKGEPMY